MKPSYERILRIDWNRVGSNVRESHLEKVGEFFRLAGQVFKQTNTYGLPFYTDPRRILNQPTVGDSAELPPCPFPLATICASRFLIAAELADQGVEHAQTLQQAFEQLIDVFEDGGSIDLHHGDLTVDGCWSLSVVGWFNRHARS